MMTTVLGSDCSRIVLSEGDVSIREVDVRSLLDQNWITDNIIAYYIEKLNNTHHKNRVDRCNKKDEKNEMNISFCDASVSFLLQYGGTELAASVLTEANCISPVSQRNRNNNDNLVVGYRCNHSAIGFVLNNSRREQSSSFFSGTHWSLLVFEKKSHSFFHLDSNASYPSASPPGHHSKHKSSFDSYNDRAAATLAQVLSPLLLTSASSPSPPSSLPSLMKVPQQQNGYDCGIYVLNFMQQLHQLYNNNTDNNNNNNSNKNDDANISLRDVQLKDIDTNQFRLELYSMIRNEEENRKKH